MTLQPRALRPAALTLLTLCAPGAFAQQPTQQEIQPAPQQPTQQAAQPAEQQAAQARRQAAAMREQVEAQRQQQIELTTAQAQVQREQSELRRELAQARENMEAAAREVARLSSQLVEPVVRDVSRRFAFAGPRGMLGVAIEDTELGARVKGVTPNGPGAEAGLAVGDTIVAVDGAELAVPGKTGQSPSRVLIAQMENVKPGDDVELRVLRDGDYRNVKVKAREQTFDVFVNPGVGVAPLPAPPGVWRDFLFRPNVWGDMQLAVLSPELGDYFGTREGLLVVHAAKNASVALQDGDVILEIGGRKPTSPEHAMRILGSFEPGETLRIAVMRHKKRETLEGKIPAESSQ